MSARGRLARPARQALPISPLLRHSQRGQSMTEYVVVCAAIAFALGVGMATDESVLKQLLEAFREAYQKFAYALSLPT